MFVVYPGIFYKDKESERYVVVFPDLDFGATQGENLTDAFYMATDFIGSWLYDYGIQKKEFPKASDIKNIVIEDDEFSIKEKSFISLVGVDVYDYIKKHEKTTIRKNVTIPSYLNEMAKNKKIDFSKLLQQALKKELGI